MFSSIRIKLILSYLTVIILAMGLSGFLLLSFLERYFLEATEDGLLTQAQITAQALIPGAVAQSPPGDDEAQRSRLASVYNTIQQQQSRNLSLQTENVFVPELATGNMDLSYLSDASLQFSAQLETRIQILDTQGTVLVDSRQEQQGMSLQDDPLVTQALTGQYASRTDQSGENDWMYLALPTVVDNQLVGVIYVSQPLSDVTAILSDLRTRWLAATLIALVLSGLVGLLLSTAIARPLRRLTVAAAAVAQGQLDQQVPVRSRDEIGRLSRTFNEMTARLQASRQMQIDFVANVSHELRTPLTSIKGMIETLRDGAVDDLEVRDHFLGTVENETDRLTRLVNDLLILSRADSEALNLRRESCDLPQLVHACLERLTPLANTKHITLASESASAVPPAWADSDRIEQVLVNLLDNAIKFSKPGDTVTVKITAGPDQSVLVQVCDDGLGIPAEDLPRIGQRFYRVDKARTRTEGGSGLGLAIAQALVSAHGGQLWLESQDGQGTVVSFTLPAL
ncbi:MAG: cell wall metabolism sensor histidine kinase WalK [Rhodobacteraceae bacterium]|nr:cell wall metabolism sensor histidine kinase WalK [Paracoccaceae bacterium]